MGKRTVIRKLIAALALVLATITFAGSNPALAYDGCANPRDHSALITGYGTSGNAKYLGWVTQAALSGGNRATFWVRPGIYVHEYWIWGHASTGATYYGHIGGLARAGGIAVWFNTDVPTVIYQAQVCVGPDSYPVWA